MHKFIRHVFLLCLVLPAFSSTTRIVDTIRDPYGRVRTCTVKLTPSKPFRTASGVYVNASKTVSCSALGVLDVSVEPTDAANPVGVYYNAEITVDKVVWREKWNVPTTADTLTTADVQIVDVPSSSYLVPFRQLDATNVASGTYCLSVLNNRVVGLVACGGTGGGGLPQGVTWADYAGTMWSALVGTIWSELES